MRKIASLTTAVVMTLFAGNAFAESEGNFDPTSFSAEQTVVRGPAFAADASAEAYPVLTGNANRSPTLAQLQPAAGSEMLLQTANSLPVQGRVGVALAQVRPTQARSLEAGVARPAG